jgi:uncharacterized protein
MTKGQAYIAQYEARITDLCRRYSVERMYLFGSVLTDAFDEEKSDVDVQAIFDERMEPLERGKTISSFWDALENLFHLKVDLLTKERVNNNLSLYAASFRRKLPIFLIK